MILNDTQITNLCVGENPMISPFAYPTRQKASGEKIVSYGVSSFGYDARMAPEFKLAKASKMEYLDPKSHNELLWHTQEGSSILIPEHGFVLTRTVEYFTIPENVMCLVLGKSTYARLGLVVNATPLEPDWCGHITLELSNTTNIPIRVYANEGIAQILFFAGERPAITYADKQGKYQDQRGITMARV